MPLLHWFSKMQRSVTLSSAEQSSLAPCFGMVEYGYRVRADAAKVPEDQIREAKGNLNPFEDVLLLERPADGVGAPPEPTLMEKFNKWLNPYGTGKEDGK